MIVHHKANTIAMLEEPDTGNIYGLHLTFQNHPGSTIIQQIGLPHPPSEYIVVYAFTLLLKYILFKSIHDL